MSASENFLCMFFLCLSILLAEMRDVLAGDGTATLKHEVKWKVEIIHRKAIK